MIKISDMLLNPDHIIAVKDATTRDPGLPDWPAVKIKLAGDGEWVFLPDVTFADVQQLLKEAL